MKTSEKDYHNGYVLEYINEYWRIRKDAKKDDLYLLETALFIEDVFGIRLNDDDISFHLLKDPEAIAQCVQQKLSGEREKKGHE
jgi:hypothetical protein